MKLSLTAHTFVFAGGLCVACSILVSASAVGLREMQEQNRILDRRYNVLQAAGLIDYGERMSADEINEIFEDRITGAVIELETGEEDPDADPDGFDQRAQRNDPSTSRSAPTNPAGVRRVPDKALVYYVYDGDNKDIIVLPIEGEGLWSTLYGYLALDADTRTIRGLTFYEHGETPGLGGEVDNPNWKDEWPGRKAFDDDWEPVIEVARGSVGPPDEDPHQVDGLAGATITARGVTHMLQFWLGEHGFQPLLERLRDELGEAQDA